MNAAVMKLTQVAHPQGLLVGAVLLMSAVWAWFLTPDVRLITAAPMLETIVPTSFQQWRQVPELFPQVGLTTNQDDEINQLYDRVLMRTYVNKQGEQVMLALAYASEQKQDIKIHRPEVCYVAQGFQLLHKQSASIHMPHKKTIVTQQLIVRNQNRTEAITYWIRIGDEYPVGGMAARMKILRDGLKGKVVDGVLVRASTVVDDADDAAAAYKQHEQFLTGLLASLPLNQQALLAVTSH